MTKQPYKGIELKKYKKNKNNLFIMVDYNDWLIMIRWIA